MNTLRARTTAPDRRSSAAERRPGEARASIRPGFTLLELVVSLAITSILLVAMGSTLVVASRALPTGTGRPEQAIRATRIMNGIASELAYATDIVRADPGDLEFVVERGGVPVAIRYRWDGTPGSPLERTYGPASPVTIAEHVQSWLATYEFQAAVTLTANTVTTLSDEILLATFNGWSGNPGSGQSLSLSAVYTAGEFFIVDDALLPPHLNRVFITRAGAPLRATQSGASAEFAMHRGKGGGNPEPAQPLGPSVSAAVPQSGSPVWVEAEFPNLAINNFNKELVLVITAVGPQATIVSYRAWTGAPADDTAFVWSSNGGTKWDPRKSERDENDMLFYVWGKFETETTEMVEQNTNTLLSARLELQTAGNPTMESQVWLLNEPALPTP